MQTRIFSAALAALLFVLVGAPVALADIVDLSNEVRLPNKREISTPWGTPPSDGDLRASGKGNLKIAYDAISIDGTRGDAAQVSAFWVTQALLENAAFALGEKQGERGFWDEAAEAFRSAAASLDGAAKQVALYKRMIALANANKEEEALKAADEVLKSDDKPYYFGPAQETRARIFARMGKLGDAQAALKAVTDAPGMNVRDYFNAAYLNVWLTTFVSAKNAEQYAAAEKAFRGLLTELDRHPRRDLAVNPRLRILMSQAASVRSQGRSDEAKKIFDEILAATQKNADPSILAGVYYGMGDVAFEEASALQASGVAGRKDKVKELLDKAALHYLRVMLLYKDFAGQRELVGATLGAARVFATLFTLSEEKDCEMGRRGYDYYVQAVQMQPRGEARRLLVKEGRALKLRIDAVCEGGGAATPEETGEGDE